VYGGVLARYRHTAEDVSVRTPETRYAKTPDGVHIAYQVFGDGPIDLVVVMGWMTNIEAMWDEPAFARMLTRLGSFARVIAFDKRGCGLSDRVSLNELASLETRMDDMRTVMDAAGSERAVVYGISEGGPMAMLFAATYPERTIALAVFGSHWTWVPESSDAWAAHHAYLEQIEASWGTEEFARMVLAEWAAPSIADDERAVRWLASYLRGAASPGAAVAYARMNESIDVGGVLPSIRVPTVVIARTGDLAFPIDNERRMASRIPGATLVELPGIDHFPWVGDQEALNDALEQFVRDARADEAELQRVLATVLFTDIVGSTARSAELGDVAWGELAARHHALVRGQLARFRGVEVEETGDGFFATFDGPIRAARCALAIAGGVRDLGLEIRAGLHTGEVDMSGEKVTGIAIVVGARVGAMAGPSEVLATSTVRDLVAGSSLTFEEFGEHELKGVPGSWRLYRVGQGG
jgi:pimeloyl-ACP methyl ester carboxylesterase